LQAREIWEELLAPPSGIGPLAHDAAAWLERIAMERRVQCGAGGSLAACILNCSGLILCFLRGFRQPLAPPPLSTV
jgi:hypothetical protein